MSQLRERIWQYFREHHRMPLRTLDFDALIDETPGEEALFVLRDLAAMRIVGYMLNEGKEQAPEQQAQQVSEMIGETAAAMAILTTTKDEGGTSN